MYAEIARARAASEPEPGVLGTLVGERGEAAGLSDLEVRDQVVSMIAAGYETTSAAMAWVLYGLAGRPDVMAHLREEVAGVDADPEALAGLPLLTAVVSEALRLYPPAAISARFADQAFDFAGRRIPRGRLVLFSPYVTHRDPAVYADALTFRPERWLETPRRPAAEFLPFGGGAHHCIGSTQDAECAPHRTGAPRGRRPPSRPVDPRPRPRSTLALRTSRLAATVPITARTDHTPDRGSSLFRRFVMPERKTQAFRRTGGFV